MSRVTDRNDWKEIWTLDKQSIIKTMRQNLASDLVAGYDVFGMNIQKQLLEIAAYEDDFNRKVSEMNRMTDVAANKYCYYDLKKRGAID